MSSERLQNINQTSSDDITFKDVIIKIKEWCHYLLSKWMIILFIGLVGGCLGFAYAGYKKPVYTATTTFVLEESGGGGMGGLGQYSGLASMVGIEVGQGGGLFSGDNIIELYKSRNMVRKALLSSAIIDEKRQLLVERFIEFNKLNEKWQGTGLSDVNFKDSSNFTLLQDSLLRGIIKDIKNNYLTVSKPDKKLSIINVEVKASDEIFAKLFTDQIVATVNNFYVETKTKRSIENINILQHQKDSVQAVMNGAIFASAKTLDATPNLNPTRQALRAPVQRSQFNAETNKAILGELVKNLELSKITLRKETPLIQVIDNPRLPLEKQALGKFKGGIIGFSIACFLFSIMILLRKILKETLK
ncbi:Wzz/FepE/Etk N-terminal domain-containing protein [Pedobacter immunditicola]|uniref:Wzz/FepE/Etk N-terminal domain-containing protein n=1 Tax=Pedobacter immunditicola TaxID=3133440 RepID=UPI00309C999E